MIARKLIIGISPFLLLMFLLIGSIYAVASPVSGVVSSIKINTETKSETKSETNTGARANEASPFMDEFFVKADARNIVHESAGRIWFTAPASNTVGLLVVTTTVDFRVDKFTPPTANSQPYDLVLRNGEVWFTEKAGNKLARLVPQTGVITEFTLPTVNSKPTGIALAPDGLIWVVQSATDKLASFDPTTQQFTEYQYVTSNGTDFEDIAIGSDNRIWITAPKLNGVVFFSTINKEFTARSTAPYIKPLGIVIGPSDLPWVTAQSASSTESDVIGLYAPGTLAIWKWYTTSTISNSLGGLYYRQTDTSNEVWYTGAQTGSAGRIVTRLSQALQSTQQGLLSQANQSAPWGITVDSNSDVWVAASGSRTIVRWRSPYFFYTHLPLVQK